MEPEAKCIIFPTSSIPFQDVVLTGAAGAGVLVSFLHATKKLIKQTKTNDTFFIRIRFIFLKTCSRKYMLIYQIKIEYILPRTKFNGDCRKLKRSPTGTPFLV